MTRARDLAAFVSNADGDIKFDTDTLFIDSSANRVAIGNTAPSRPLHITANPAMILLEDSDGGSDDKKAQIQVDSGAFEVNARNDDDSSRTDNILVADLGTGDIGIGTNTPLQRLTIFDDNSDINMSNVPAGQFGIDGNGYGFAIALNSSGAQMYTNSASRNLIFGVNETERMSITTDKVQFSVDAKVDTDNSHDLGSGGARWKDLYLSGGAYIGGTAGANKLDDYEQGTWTPSIASGASSSVTVNFARYVKVGELVFANFYISSISSKTSSQLKISGLPFTVASGGYSSSIFETSTGGHWGLFRSQTNSTQAFAYKFNETSSHRENYAGTDIGTHIICGLTYISTA